MWVSDGSHFAIKSRLSLSPRVIEWYIEGTIERVTGILVSYYQSCIAR